MTAGRIDGEIAAVGRRVRHRHVEHHGRGVRRHRDPVGHLNIERPARPERRRGRPTDRQRSVTRVEDSLR